MDSVVATVSGYHGSERFNLIKLISQAGASYVGAMNSSTTHLVCHKFEGKKYELARKFKTIVVNHRWIEDCIKQGRRVSERPYMKRCGFEEGPLLLEIPNAANEVRRVFGEVSTTRNCSKTPVIDIECGDDGDKWTDCWLLKENLLPDMKETNDRSNRLKRKGTKRCSRQNVLLTNKYCLDEASSMGLKRLESEHLSSPSSSHHKEEGKTMQYQKRKNTTISEPSKRSRRLIHKSICNELTSSDSEEEFKHTDSHSNDIDICGPSCNYGKHESKTTYKTRFHNHGKRRALILEEIEDLGTTSDHQDNSAEVEDDDCNKKDHIPRSSKEVLLSCVICWTDFSSIRGVLPCGHRFCFSCIQNWADHMASMNKVSTCPLCKANFYSIQKMEDDVCSDQKIYSQTIPNECLITDVYILPYGESSTHQTLPPPTPVCYRCSCREPEELLIKCHSCQIHCVHSYCLDPPQVPWVCVRCKDLRMRYVR